MNQEKQGKIALKLVRRVISDKGLPSVKKMRGFLGLAKKIGIPRKDLDAFTEALIVDFASQVIAKSKK